MNHVRHINHRNYQYVAHAGSVKGGSLFFVRTQADYTSFLSRFFVNPAATNIFLAPIAMIAYPTMKRMSWVRMMTVGDDHGGTTTARNPYHYNKIKGLKKDVISVKK